MKIHILYKFKDGPWGGGNQFLKALRDEFVKMNIYENSPKKSAIILFNSHQNLSEVLKLKYNNPNKIFIHRVDGPIIYTRGKDIEIDKLIFKFSQKIADFTIFQSKWSYNKCKGLGFENSSTIIYNAPDNKIFSAEGGRIFNAGEKIRLIATSWSANRKKGFDTYKYLDENLDFTKYDMIFIGNSPVKFKNIKQIPPLSSNDLAQELKKSDIFITASKNDPCSNSLIEALSCGLPCIVLNDGGHPELIGNGGEVFNRADEIPNKIEIIAENYHAYKKNIPKYIITSVAGQYLKIFKKNNIAKKRIGKITFLNLKIDIFIVRFKGFLKNILSK